LAELLDDSSLAVAAWWKSRTDLAFTSHFRRFVSLSERD